MAFGTIKHTLFMIRRHLLPAASAVLVDIIPAIKMVGGNSGESGVPGHGGSENAYIFVGIAGEHNCRGVVMFVSTVCAVLPADGKSGQKVFIIINGKEIIRDNMKGRQLFEDGISEPVFLKAYQYGVFVENQNKIVFGGGNVVVFIVVGSGVNILYHFIAILSPAVKICVFETA